jgi:hypothetical protein
MATAVRNDPLDQLDVFWIGPDRAIASDFVNVTGITSKSSFESSS